MSYRDIDAPSKAFESLLRSLQSRMGRIERRIRWPGATHLSESSALPDLVAASGWQTQVSVALDPGSWLILAGASFQCQAVGDTSIYRMDARVVSTFTGGQTVTSGRSPSGFTATDTVIVQGISNLAAAETLSFQLSYNNFTAGQPDAEVLEAYLIAAPF